MHLKLKAVFCFSYQRPTPFKIISPNLYAKTALRVSHIRPTWPCQRSPASGRDFFGCTDNDLEERDAAIAASRKAYEEHRAEELSLGPPIGASEIQPE